MSRKHLAVAVILGATLLVSALPVSADGPFQYYPLTPCRLVDTRNTYQSQGGYGPGLVTAQRKAFPIQGNCLVPVGVKAVTLNVTVAKPTAQATLSQGYLSVYPTGGAEPLVSTINFPKGTIALANGAIVPVAQDLVTYPKDLTVKAALVGGGKVEVILDVTGYFQ
jgi:hypothetical protein